MLKNYLPKFFVTFFLLLLIYVFYKSEFVWNGSRRNYYFIYYIVAINFLILSLILNFVNQSIKNKIYLSFSFLIIGFYIFETLLIIYYPSETIRKKIVIKKNYDTRSKINIYNDIKKSENISLTLKVIEKNKLASLSGASNIKTIFCNENGEYSFFNSDRYGFNNPDEEWEKKNIDYFILGNSFAQGACVNRPFDISSQLRIKFKKSSLNMGYRNQGPLSQLATLKEYYKPGVKNVIWLYSEDNDLNTLTKELNSKILTNYLDDNNFSQNLKDKQKEIDTAVKKEILKIINNSKKSQIFNFFKLNSSRLFIYNFFPKKYQPISKELKFDDIFLKIVLKAKNFSEKNKSNFYFVYLPDFKRYSLKDYSDENFERIKIFLKDNNIKFIDINDLLFSKVEDPFIFFPLRMYGHYNQKGYSKISEVLIKKTF